MKKVIVVLLAITQVSSIAFAKLNATQDQCQKSYGKVVKKVDWDFATSRLYEAKDGVRVQVHFSHVDKKSYEMIFMKGDIFVESPPKFTRQEVISILDEQFGKGEYEVKKHPHTDTHEAIFRKIDGKDVLVGEFLTDFATIRIIDPKRRKAHQDLIDKQEE